MKKTILFLSCEHAVNHIPPAYADLFLNQKEILKTHRGYDIGSLEVTHAISKALQVESVTSNVSRLLIDCNRTLNHKNCFSEFTKSLSNHDKQILINEYYLPYRTKCENFIAEIINSGKQIFHLSVHSFVPKLNDEVRQAAIGLLYDPRRHAEKEVTREWHRILCNEVPHYKTKLNYPYSGISDSFPFALRKKYQEDSYLGIELEINQHLLKDEYSISSISNTIIDSLQLLLQLL